jgi:hypothetical protein
MLLNNGGKRNYLTDELPMLMLVTASARMNAARRSASGAVKSAGKTIGTSKSGRSG